MRSIISHNKASPQNWHNADIKAALEKRGWSLRRLAMHHGYTASMLTSALHRSYPHAEEIIAEAIGETPEKIWPERYLMPSRRGPRVARRKQSPKRTTAVDSRNGYAGGAA